MSYGLYDEDRCDPTNPGPEPEPPRVAFDRLEARLVWLERIEEAARANYASMAAHYGDSEEEWWPQLYVALAATEEGAEE